MDSEVLSGEIQSARVQTVMVAEEDCPDRNLNSLNLFASEFSTDEEFEDWGEATDAESLTVLEKTVMTNKIVAKRLRSIPQLTKEPSPLMKYLLFSNVCSLLFYLRRWNGRLILDDQLPKEAALNIAEALVTQLLSKNSQYKV